jgi:general secretion pathway protein G
MKKINKGQFTKTKLQSGFSLIEIMIAITILGLVMALVGTNVIEKLDEAKVTTTKNQIRALEASLQDYYRHNGSYPTTDQGLDALVEKPTTGKIPKNWNPDCYIEKCRLPLDAWDNDFIYKCDDGFKFEIISLGAGGQEGGDGFAADVSSKDL